jgi:hypothetical protein
MTTLELHLSLITHNICIMQISCMLHNMAASKTNMFGLQAPLPEIFKNKNYVFTFASA